MQRPTSVTSQWHCPVTGALMHNALKALGMGHRAVVGYVGYLINVRVEAAAIALAADDAGMHSTQRGSYQPCGHREI